MLVNNTTGVNANVSTGAAAPKVAVSAFVINPDYFASSTNFYD